VKVTRIENGGGGAYRSCVFPGGPPELRIGDTTQGLAVERLMTATRAVRGAVGKKRRLCFVIGEESEGEDHRKKHHTRNQ